MPKAGSRGKESLKKNLYSFALAGGSARSGTSSVMPVTSGHQLRRLLVVAVAAFMVTTLSTVQRAEAYGSSKPPSAARPSVSAGGYMTCALDDANQAACWGANVGQGTPPTSGTWSEGWGQAHAPAGITFSEVNAGYSHACGVRNDAGNQNTVACWGSDHFGASTGTMGGAALGACSANTPLPTTAYNEGCANPVGAPTAAYSHIAAGRIFTCGIRRDPGGPDDKKAACWGINERGTTAAADHKQIGTTPTSDEFKEVTVGVRHACGLRVSDSKVQCWGSNQFNQTTNQPTVALKQISSGNFDICAIKDSDDRVVCWGRNQFGQQTIPTDPSTGLGVQFKQINAGHAHVCGIRLADDQVQCWGTTAALGTNPNFGQLNPPAGTFREISAGTFTSCGVRTDNSWACWGDNAQGRISPWWDNTTTGYPAPPSNTNISWMPAPVGTYPTSFSHEFHSSYLSTATWALNVTYTDVLGNPQPAPSWLTLTPFGGSNDLRQKAKVEGSVALNPQSAGTYTVTVSVTNGFVTNSSTFTITVHADK